MAPHAAEPSVAATVPRPTHAGRGTRSGTNRVFSARGGGDCGSAPPYQCHEPNGSVPLPGIENYHVRIDPDSLYVCDTLLGWESHFPWPQPSQIDIEAHCIGACGADCSTSTCTRTPTSGYIDVGGGQACRDTHDSCYASDCCWYHDLCGRMFPTAVFTDPFCHALAIVYGCVACIGSGFPGCSSPPSYTTGFDHPYTDRRDCTTTCTDRPGDCYDDCTGQCWPGCDVNFDCYDDCTGQYICDPCGGDPCCGDPCCGDPCCGDPECEFSKAPGPGGGPASSVAHPVNSASRAAAAVAR